MTLPVLGKSALAPGTHCFIFKCLGIDQELFPSRNRGWAAASGFGAAEKYSPQRGTRYGEKGKGFRIKNQINVWVWFSNSEMSEFGQVLPLSRQTGADWLNEASSYDMKWVFLS